MDNPYPKYSYTDKKNPTSYMLIHSLYKTSRTVYGRAIVTHQWAHERIHHELAVVVTPLGEKTPHPALQNHVSKSMDDIKTICRGQQSEIDISKSVV